MYIRGAILYRNINQMFKFALLFHKFIRYKILNIYFNNYKNKNYIYKEKLLNNKFFKFFKQKIKI